MNLADLNPSQNLKVLVIGESGAGKTCFASTFPNSMFFHDFDNKINSAAGFLRVNAPEKLKGIDYAAYPLADAGTSINKFEKWLNESEQAARDGKFTLATIVLDSITTFCDLLMERVIRQNPGIKTPVPGVPGLQHYGIFAVNFRQMIGRFLALPCNVVCIGHLDKVKDESTGEILRQALVPGKNAQYLPIIFQEVYRAYTETKDGKTQYLAQTKSDSKFNCRTQIQKLPAVIELSYESLIKKY